jgi:His-Xaa-Ser system protein HxsD
MRRDIARRVERLEQRVGISADPPQPNIFLVFSDSETANHATSGAHEWQRRPHEQLTALNAAAYRLIGTAACLVEQSGGRYVCRLTSHGGIRENRKPDFDTLRTHFIDLVTDENLREQLSVKTEPVRNLILSLAFGSLAAQPKEKS